MKNLFDQEQWERRGENDARLSSHVARITILEAASRPLGTLGHAEVTANQGSITTVVDLTGLSAAVTVGTNRKIRVTGFVRSWASTVASDRVHFSIREGATVLNQAVILTEPAAGNAAGGGVVQWVSLAAPSAGAHTYKLSADSADGGTLTMAAAATFPAYILVEDIGAA